MKNQITKRFQVSTWKNFSKNTIPRVNSTSIRNKIFLLVPSPSKKEPSQKHFDRLCKDSPHTSMYDFIPSSYCSKYRPSLPDKIRRKLNNFKRLQGTLGKLRINARFPPPLERGSRILKHRFVKWKRSLRRNINGELNPADVLIMIKAYCDSLYRLRRRWLHVVINRYQPVSTPFRSIITYHTILNH